LPDVDRTRPVRLPRFANRALNRREFLALSSAAVLGSILAACSNGDDDEETPAVSESASPTLVRSTPGVETTPGTAETPTPTVAGAASPSGSPGADRSVAMFLALSSALTGFEGLDDQELAQTYLTNLGSEGDALVDLFSAVGLDSPDATVTFDRIHEAGVFDDEALARLADKITVYWYSGKYQQPDGNVAVATFINALAWPATGYRITGPSTCTGQTGVWATPPA